MGTRGKSSQAAKRRFREKEAQDFRAREGKELVREKPSLMVQNQQKFNYLAVRRG